MLNPLRVLQASFLAATLFLCAGAYAADMAKVREALAEQRYFDAFVDLQDLATGGNAEAQYELAGFHHYGRVGPVNFEKAFNWYTRSANQGNADAMVGLAVMYGHGQGVPEDKFMAYRWLVIASNSGLSAEDAERIAGARDELGKSLSQAEIDAALAAAREFTPKPEQ